MKGLSGTNELGNQKRMGCHSDNARALCSRRILTQNRYPRLLKAALLAGFFQ